MNDVSAGVDKPHQNETKTLNFEFRGDGMEYFKIWIVNVLLTIVTLGIYSAWATVRNKRYFYSNLYLGEDNFRYLAEPLTILKGRIIAVIAFIIYMAASALFPVAAMIFLLILIISIPYFINQSLAFNNRMTSFKNIQFRFKSTYGEAFMVAYVWPVLGMLTIGILYPLFFVKANKYVVNNSAYGTTNFEFDATYKDYGIIFLTLIGIGAVASILIFALTNIGSQATAALIPIIMVLMYFGLIVYFIVATANLFYKSVSISGHNFDADLTIQGMAKVILINAFFTLITLGLYLPAAKVRMTKYVSSCLTMHVDGDLNNFVAAEKESVSALGEEIGQVFDFT